MANFRIKLHGVNNIESASFQSMLDVSTSRLDSDWIVLDAGQADVHFYDIDSDIGREAFKAHRSGISVVISHRQISDTLADDYLKKPLRVKYLTELLNNIEQKIELNLKTDNHAQTPTVDLEQQAKFVSQETVIPEAKKPGLLDAVSQRLLKSKSPAADLPSLNIFTFSPSTSAPANTLSTKAFHDWFRGIEQQSDHDIINALLDRLNGLNQTKLAAEKRLSLLECYRDYVLVQATERDIETIKLEIDRPDLFNAQNAQLHRLIDALAVGYKSAVMAYYQQGQRPQSHPAMHFAIIRSAELLSLSVLHALQCYRSPSLGTVNELHQLYIYCEAADILDKTVSLDSASANKPFSHYYHQLMLTSMADPYSLAKHDVLRLFKLMAKMADKVDIGLLSAAQQSNTTPKALDNYFCIACHSDQLVVPLHLVEQKDRQNALTRLFNPHAMVLTTKQLLASAAQQSLDGYGNDIQLLSSLLPRFSSQYSRIVDRYAGSTDMVNIDIASGFNTIHSQLAAGQVPSPAIEWQVVNSSQYGMMVTHPSSDLTTVDIGDFVYVVTSNEIHYIACIRWLRIDHNDALQIGLETHLGPIEAVQLSATGNTAVIDALYIPKQDEHGSTASLIVEKGGFTPDRRFTMTLQGKTIQIMAQQLLDDSKNYQRFDYKVLSDS